MLVGRCQDQKVLNYRCKKIVVIALVTILSGLIVLTGCQSDGQTTPVYLPVAAPPVEVSIDQLLSDYMLDEVAADTKYRDKRLLFTNVKVEKIIVYYPTTADDPIIYIRNNSFEFRPRYFQDTVSVRSGFVVDIVGEARGLFGVGGQYLIVDNCWVKIIEDGGGAPIDAEALY
ncbi:hypothetical protein ACFLYB_06970 [Chloroflexota bacterium]